MAALWKREFRSYFQSMVGYLFIALILAFVGVFLWLNNLSGGYPNFEYTLSSITILFLLLIPILTMRTMTEERQKRTDQLLYALPLTSTQILLSKFAALAAVFAIPCGIMFFYPMLLGVYGTVNFATAYTGLLGFFLLGCALLALALFLSSFSDNQIVAAATTFAVIFLLYLMSSFSSAIPADAAVSFWSFVLLVLALSPVVYLLSRAWVVTIAFGVVGVAALSISYLVKPALFEGALGAVMRFVSVFDRFIIFTNGMFDIGNLVYLITFCAFFLFLAIEVFEKRRWS